MTTDIVQSLFGVTPQSYQQAQADSADAQAMAFARLSPIEQATYGVSRGAYGLAGAIGGALGGKDPELQRYTMRQQIAGQINPNDLDSFRGGIVAMKQAGDGEGAFMLNQELQKILVGQSTIAKNEAAATSSLATATRERTPNIPNDIQLARESARLQEQINQLTDLPSSPQRDQALRIASGQLKELERLTAKAIPLDPRFGVDRESVAMASYGKSFAQLTQNEQTLVNKSVEDSKGKTAAQSATTITNVLPGVVKASDVTGLRNSIIQSVKPYRDAINDADKAISLADNVLSTGNFAAFASLTRALAKGSGEIQLSKADVMAFGGDPSFVGSIYDMASKIATGTPTADTVRKLKDLAILLKKKNQALENSEIRQLQKTARISGNFTEPQIKEAFTLRGETKGATRKTAGGVSYTVED